MMEEESRSLEVEAVARGFDLNQGCFDNHCTREQTRKVQAVDVTRADEGQQSYALRLNPLGL